MLDNIQHCYMLSYGPTFNGKNKSSESIILIPLELSKQQKKWF